MKGRTTLSICPILFLFALFDYAKAADESFPDRFLGSPLLILVAVIIIDIITLVYHKMRK